MDKTVRLAVVIISLLIGAGLASCTGKDAGGAEPVTAYDAGVCEKLSDKYMADAASLTPDDYDTMIEQYEAILDYYADLNRRFAAIEDSDQRRSEIDKISRTPENVDRVTYMTLFAIALDYADTTGRLPEKVAARYRKLQERPAEAQDIELD